MPKIIYEPHPVTPERKTELRAQGFRIIDAVFAPPGEQTADQPAEGAEQAPKRGRKKAEADQPAEGA